jgi:hypothetical protein
MSYNMDSRQQTIQYLMLEASELSKVCAEALMAINKNKADIKVEAQVGVLLNAVKEATIQLAFSEDRVMVAAEKEQLRREKDL